MKVKKLIEILQKLNLETNIYINGYEGGIDDVVTVIDIKVKRNVFTEEYMGRHDTDYGYQTRGFTLPGYSIK